MDTGREKKDEEKKWIKELHRGSEVTQNKKKRKSRRRARRREHTPPS